MNLKEAKKILDACAKHDVAKYKEAQKVFAEAKATEEAEETEK